MESFQYQLNIPYTDINSIVALVRHKITQLRQTDPKLAAYQLADIGMKKTRRGVNITLYFAPKMLHKLSNS